MARRRVEYQPQGLVVVAPDGSRVAIDVAVTNSVQIAYMSRSAVRAGVAAAAREMNKINHYKPLPDNLRFQPLVVETFGAWGPTR